MRLQRSTVNTVDKDIHEVNKFIETVYMKNDTTKTETVKETPEETEKSGNVGKKPVCGIIMPISQIDNCSMDHWTEVKTIISEAVCDAGYTPNLVSNADDIGIIQKRIIQNLYDNDIVVCDVSGKNPNVMFELGMRLAFDKPAIIVIDDKTDYSFDTSPIEHLSYPRDLRYYDIIRFKDQLKTKIIATVNKAKEDSTYTTFLKNFGEFEVAHVEKKQGTMDDVILSKIDELSNRFFRLERQMDMMDILGDIRKNERLYDLVRIEIDDFCDKAHVSFKELKKEPELWADRMLPIIEDNGELRKLCGSRSELRRQILKVLNNSIG